MKYSLDRIAEIVGGLAFNGCLEVDNIITDSRNNVPNGALFVALKSDTNDGHKYIENLESRGVRAFLVENRDAIKNQHSGYVLVENTLVALQTLAAYHRSQFKGTVVAITGSNGKTIVKEWFAQMWDSNNGKLFRSPRSYNSQLGVALSLLMIEGDEKVAFIEAGVSKVGEMSALEAMIKPDVGVFTNIGAAHSEGFISAEDKLKEKEILFKNAKTIIRAPKEGNIDQINLKTVISIYNTLKTSYLNTQPKSVNMRLEVKEGINGSIIINDSYSNDITSFAIALDFAQRTPTKRRVVILSDIAGNDYITVNQLLNDHKIDLLVGVGDNISKAKYDCQTMFFNSTDQFITNFDPKELAESVVLVKGGRVFEFEKIVKKIQKRTHMTVLEVNLEKMVANLNHYRKLIKPTTKIMAMVKASGYGSGNLEVASVLEHQNVDCLAVAYADEGMMLRRGGIHTPIVVLNSDNESYEVMIENRLEPEIYSFETLEKFIDQAVRASVSGLPIHIKIDSGMHRLGFLENEIETLIDRLNSQNVVYAASVFSHFAASEDPNEDSFSQYQFNYYKRCADNISNNVKQSVKPIQHICNTAAIERFPDRHLDMVRVGIGLYTKEVVSSLVTKIAQIKTYEVGETIGYNRRGVVNKRTKVAVIPIGYADGLFRTLGNGVGKFNIGGILCPTIGNICMDTCMVDISEVTNAQTGDRVVIFGQYPTAKQLAQSIGTIDYELLTAVAPRIKRVYISE